MAGKSWHAIRAFDPPHLTIKVRYPAINKGIGGGEVWYCVHVTNMGEVYSKTAL